MTLHATRDGQRITVHGNTGVHVHVQDSKVSEAGFTEDAQHVRHFWGLLGRLLDEAEHERQAVDRVLGTEDKEHHHGGD